MSKEGKARVSAGLVMYRICEHKLEIFLAHPGGPYFARKDAGHWTIPKGQPSRKEDDLLETARREFQEETGIEPKGPFEELGWIQQKGGKIVYAWGFEGDLPEGHKHSCNLFKMEWPPASGYYAEFPEIDKACFFPIAEARVMIKSTQVELLERLAKRLGL